MQRSEATQGSSSARNLLVANRKFKRCSAAEGAVCNDKPSDLSDARNGQWAAARCYRISGDCRILEIIPDVNVSCQ